MRLTLYRNELWTLALLALSCISTMAQAPAPAVQSAVVQTVSALPDSGSLLPVAGIVGFSFLIGGIVCRMLKTRL